MMDPANGVQVPVVAQFWLILAMLAFLMMNGHLVLISAIADTFTVLLVATDGISRAGPGAVSRGHRACLPRTADGDASDHFAAADQHRYGRGIARRTTAQYLCHRVFRSP